MLSSSTVRRFLVIVPLLVIAFAIALANSPLFAADPSPFHGTKSATEAQPTITIIPGQYIVTYRDDVALSATDSESLVSVLGGKLLYTYDTVLKGVAVANLSDAAYAQLQVDPRVAYIEPDQIITVQDDPNVGGNTTFLPFAFRSDGSTPDSHNQTGAAWGLDRIDQRTAALNRTFSYSQTGQNVHAYVIDSGIRSTHTEFAGRIGTGFDAVDGDAPDDCYGHGTHVAGTLGGTTYGVAKEVTLHAVRVLNCTGQGTLSGVIAGVEWVATHHQSPAVANMSLGGSGVASLDNAVNGLIASGVTVVVAAGNNAINACEVSPARTPNAITVGATNGVDARAGFSNWGTCLDIFAPGVAITSAWNTGDTATNTINGTSMATPHVSGVVALVLAVNPTFTPAQVADYLLATATPDMVTNPQDSANRLLFSLYSNPNAPTSYSHRATYTGDLAEGTSQNHPTEGFQVATPGMIRGTLIGPSIEDFDLFLSKWNGSAWGDVSHSDTGTSNEFIEYLAEPGLYMWRVTSFSGSGNYTLTMTWP